MNYYNNDKVPITSYWEIIRARILGEESLEEIDYFRYTYYTYKGVRHLWDYTYVGPKRRSDEGNNT